MLFEAYTILSRRLWYRSMIDHYSRFVFILYLQVFEVNTNLLAKIIDLTKGATLNDSSVAQARRDQYASFGKIATSAPTVRVCDVATSDASS